MEPSKISSPLERILGAEIKQGVILYDIPRRDEIRGGFLQFLRCYPDFDPQIRGGPSNFLSRYLIDRFFGELFNRDWLKDCRVVENKPRKKISFGSYEYEFDSDGRAIVVSMQKNGNPQTFSVHRLIETSDELGDYVHICDFALNRPKPNSFNDKYAAVRTFYRNTRRPHSLARMVVQARDVFDQAIRKDHDADLPSSTQTIYFVLNNTHKQLRYFAEECVDIVTRR